jgi:hypothetical protein
MSDNEADELHTQDGFSSEDDVGSMGTTGVLEEVESVPPTNEDARAFAEGLVLYAEQNHGVVEAIDIAVNIMLSDVPVDVVRALPQALVHADIDCVDLFTSALVETNRFRHVHLHTMIRALKKRMTGGKN